MEPEPSEPVVKVTPVVEPSFSVPLSADRIRLILLSSSFASSSIVTELPFSEEWVSDVFLMMVCFPGTVISGAELADVTVMPMVEDTVLGPPVPSLPRSSTRSSIEALPLNPIAGLKVKPSTAELIVCLVFWKVMELVPLAPEVMETIANALRVTVPLFTVICI